MASIKLKQFLNKYKYPRVKCPFCDYEAYVRSITKISPDPLRDMKRHITCAAKNEALIFCISNTGENAGDHLTYYIQHTSNKKFVNLEKRVYDNDMELC